MSDNANWPDFGIAILDKLGRAAPWIIIVALSGIGIYFFQKTTNENYARIQEISQAERNLTNQSFTLANEALTNTYQSAKTLYDETTISIKDSLSALRSVEQDLRESQEKLIDSEISAEKRRIQLEQQELDYKELEAELLITENLLEVSKNAARDLETKISHAHQELVEVRLEKNSAVREKELLEKISEEENFRLSLIQEEVQDTLKRTRKIEDELNTKTVQFNKIVERLIEADIVLRQLANIQGHERPEYIVDLAKRAQSIVPRIELLLESFSKNPNEKIQTNRLVGVTLEEVIESSSNVSDLYWYIGTRIIYPRSSSSHKEELLLVIIAEKFEGLSVIPNVLLLNFGEVSKNDVLSYIQNPELTDDVRSVVAEGAEAISVAGIKCSDLRGEFGGLIAGASASGGRSTTYSGVGKSDEYDLHKLLSDAAHIERIDGMFESPNWSIEHQSPRNVADASIEPTWIIQPFLGDVSGCLTAFMNRQKLSEIDNLTVFGLSGEENAEIGNFIISNYGKIYSKNSEFDKNLGELFEIENMGSFRTLINFLSKIAELRLRFSVSDTDQDHMVVRVSASRNANLYELKIYDPLSKLEIVDKITLTRDHSGKISVSDRKNYFATAR